MDSLVSANELFSNDEFRSKFTRGLSNRKKSGLSNRKNKTTVSKKFILRLEEEEPAQCWLEDFVPEEIFHLTVRLQLEKALKKQMVVFRTYI